MIQLQNISKSYSGTVKAASNISLHVKPGEIFGFLGPNGAGKTTTIKMITGILYPDHGQIIVNGINALEQPLEAKKQFGYVPDNPDLFLRLKGLEYLNFMADMYDVPKSLRKERIQHLAAKFDMDKALSDPILSYSHGMRQKIVIMGVLIHDPTLWILDEPLTGLDPKSAHILKEMMREHTNTGKTVFFSTHVLEVAEKLCDRVAIIHKGAIQFCGTFKEMQLQFQSDHSLESMFLELTSYE